MQDLKKVVAKIEKRTGFAPTDEQHRILEIATTLRESGLPILMIEAGAGCGKTSTDRMLVDLFGGLIGQYTAFNKPLVVESKQHFVGTTCNAKTTHALAFQAVGKHYADRLNGNRMRSERIAKILGIQPMTLSLGKNDQDEDITKRLSAGLLAGAMIGAVKRFCQSADQEIQLSHFKYLDGIDEPVDGVRTSENNNKVREYLLPFANKAWEDIQDVEGQLPFNHDYYVKIWQLNNPVIVADYILLDEAQDTAPVMLDILLQQTKREHPPIIVIVGDSAQQIYEWRGAVNALAAFPEAPRAYLSQSFRFGQAVADVANGILSELEEPTELRLIGNPNNNTVVGPAENPTAILCRTNAMAVSMLLGELANERLAFLVGGGTEMQSFVKAANELQSGQSTSHPDLACFDNWQEVVEYSEKEEGEDLKLKVKLIKEFGCETILNALESMPDEKNADIVISTAHKSKGKEWDHVQLAADFPARQDCGDPDRKLLYVAVTRAMKTLDITRCPFFLGEEGMDVTQLITRPENMPEPQQIKPVPVERPVQEKFTWTKWDDAWHVAGPEAYDGKEVTVEKRNGDKSQVQLAQTVWERDGRAIYALNRR